METRLAQWIRQTEEGQHADSILRSCVHCGFCNATCPTYQLRGDELDGPRGRIYLIKQMLEGQPASAATRTHLDRCLTCLNCETTCPSGVRYHELLEIGREHAERHSPRGWPQRLFRAGLRQVLGSPRLFRLAHTLGRPFNGLLPERLRMPAVRPGGARVTPAAHARRMILLDGCVQPTLSPAINQAAVRVLDRLGIHLSVQPGAGCCGALHQHLSAAQQARQRARANIDAWWPAIQAGAEAIVITASGCGTQVKEYGRILQADPDYHERAAQVSALARDLSEVIPAKALQKLPRRGDQQDIACHTPCSLQHGQQLPGTLQPLLAAVGYTLQPTLEEHLCCGSAGTYSIFQPEWSGQLRSRKLQHLTRGQPQQIATANIGCLHHLQAGTDTPVRHWIELVDEALDVSHHGSAQAPAIR